MTYIVTEPCVDCKYTDCAAVCPVEAFHELPDKLLINPDTCINAAPKKRLKTAGFVKPAVFIDGDFSCVYQPFCYTINKFLLSAAKLNSANNQLILTSVFNNLFRPAIFQDKLESSSNRNSFTQAESFHNFIGLTH